MKPLKRALIALTFAIFFLASPLVISTAFADWPSVRFDSGNRAATPFSITEPIEILWTKQYSNMVLDTPIVDNEGNILLSLFNKGLIALDKNGNQKWTFVGAPHNSPVLDNNGNIYFSTGGCSGYTYSLDKNGQKRWEVYTGAGGYCGAGPAVLSIDKNTLYSGVVYPSNTLLALNLDGTVKWQTWLDYQSPNNVTVGPDETIYVGTGGNGRLFALNPNGTIKWYTSTANGWTINVHAPVSDTDGNIYVYPVGSIPSAFISLNPLGRIRWTIPVSQPTDSTEMPAIKGQILYLVEKTKLKAINTTNGTTIWEWNVPVQITGKLSPPVLDKDDNIYTAFADRLFVIDSQGQTKNSITLGFYLNRVIIPQDNLILVTKNYNPDGYLIALGNKTPSKTPLIIVPGIVASSNWKVLMDRGDSGWDWMVAGDSSWRQFLDSLEKAGYQKDKDYFIAFYDWRKTNDWTDSDPGAGTPAKKYLEETIDKAKNANPGVSKVNIVAHSMGGLVTRSYIESPNYRGDVNKAFLIGSPNSGSTFAYYAWEGGVVPPNWDPVSKAGLSVIIKMLSINFLQDPYNMIHDHIKSIKDLLPVGYDYLIKNGNPFDWLNMHELNNFLKTTSNPQNTASIFASKGVGLVNITGTGQTTWEKLQAEDFSHQYLWKDGKPVGSAGIADGDNTVLTSSSNLPGAEQLTVASNHANLPNASTSQIFNKLGITYTPSNLAGAPDKIMVAWVASPVDLQVLDNSGNSVGELLTDQQTDRKWVFVENPAGDYQLKLTGTGAGKYHVGVDLYTDTKTESSATQGTAVTGAQLDYDLHIDPQNLQPLDLQPEDKIAPITSVRVSGTSGNNGWYLSDVNVSLSAADNENGGGIDKTEYSFDNINWQKYTTPLTINNEGKTIIYYRSSDLVGNLEQPKQTEIKIDKIAPEATISVNPDKEDLEVSGIDRNITTIQKLDNNETKKKDDAVYIITDEAGNTLKLDVRERDKEKQDRFRIYSIQYNDNPVQVLENNHFNVSYQGRKSKINVKEQNFEQKGEIKIRIRYDVKKDKSTVIIKEPKEEKVKEIKNGLIILQLTTNNGVLETTY